MNDSSDICYIICTVPGKDFSYAVPMQNGLKIGRIVTDLIDQYMAHGFYIFSTTVLPAHRTYVILSDEHELQSAIQKENFGK